MMCECRRNRIEDRCRLQCRLCKASCVSCIPAARSLRIAGLLHAAEVLVIHMFHQWSNAIQCMWPSLNTQYRCNRNRLIGSGLVHIYTEP